MSSFSPHDRDVVQPVQSLPAPDEKLVPREREYELRLIADDGRTANLLRFTRKSDDAARQVILGVKDDYVRYELWRGMEKIAGGPRFVIGD